MIKDFFVLEEKYTDPLLFIDVVFSQGLINNKKFKENSISIFRILGFKFISSFKKNGGY